MNIDRNNKRIISQLDKVMLQQTQRFKYLGVIVVEDRRTEEEMKEKLTEVNGLTALSVIYSLKRRISKETRVQVLEKVATSLLIYGAKK